MVFGGSSKMKPKNYYRAGTELAAALTEQD